MGLLVASVGLVAACGSDSNEPASGGNAEGGGASGGDDVGMGGAREGDPPIEVVACEPFTACGGDLEGKWKLTTHCVAPRRNEPDGLDGECRDAERYKWTEVENGSIVFTADGSFEQSGTSATEHNVFLVPTSCLDGTACDELEDDEYTREVQGDVCVLNKVEEGESATNEFGTYKLESSTIVVEYGGDDAGYQESWEYCVKGDTLTILYWDDEDGVFTETFERE